jgi:hypothetical protein
MPDDFIELGESTLIHRECGRTLERIMLYFSHPVGQPGLWCHTCYRWITLAALTRDLVKRGRWQ